MIIRDTVLSLSLVSLLLSGCSQQTSLDDNSSGAAMPFVTLRPDEPSGETPRVSAAESHQQMVDLLVKIGSRAGVHNPFLGDGRVKQYRQAMQQLPTDAPADVRWQIHRGLANQELILGNTREAIRQFESLMAWVEENVSELSEEQRDRCSFDLAIAYMRLAEDENCCQRLTAESCILPIRGSGVHTEKDGARRAVQHLARVLESRKPGSPKHAEARWLLNIAYMTLGEYPQGVPERWRISPEVFESETPFPQFRNIAQDSGLAGFNQCGGAVVEDFDGDGRLDILVSDWDPRKPLRLFHNQGDGQFQDVTESAGLTGITGGLNMVQADYNNDGRVDVLVLRGAWLGEQGQHPNSLLRNEGNLQFVDVTISAGLANPCYPTQTASWADFDNDGFLDLYVGNESPGGQVPNQLFRNKGDGTFEDVARSMGVEDFRFTKAVVWGDYDNDRFPDLFVSNLSGENRLYHNEGGRGFRDVAVAAGVTQPRQSFPAWFWDFDNDGSLDLFVSSYMANVASVASSYLDLPFQGELACLYRGDGQGNFVDVAKEANLKRLSDPMGANFGDLDGDGFLDFYLGTGYPFYEGLTPNVMYHNQGGTGFVDVSTDGGFGHLQKGHGVAFADVDNDGDQDVFEQMGGAYLGDQFSNALYQNPGFDNAWVVLKLEGTTSNRCAIGARIQVEVSERGVTRSVYRHVNSGGSFGCNPLRQHIGVGKTDRIERLTVFWPTSGIEQTFEDVEVNQGYVVSEGQATLRPLPLP